MAESNVSIPKNILKSLYLKILFLCTAFSFDLFIMKDHKNILLIFLLLTCCFYWFFSAAECREFPFYLFLGWLGIVNLLHYETMKISSYVYTILFILLLISVRRLLYKNSLSLNEYIGLLKIIIYIFFLALLIQQFCFFFHLPMFNAMGRNESWGFRFNSMALEPAHAAKILLLTFYSYILIMKYEWKKEYTLLRFIRESKFLCIAFAYSILTIGSVTALLFLPLILIPLVKLRYTFFSLLFTCLLVIWGMQWEVEEIKRLNFFLDALFSMNLENVILSDGSAAARVAPYMIYIQDFDISSEGFWFGYGAGYTVNYFNDIINLYRNYIPEGTELGGQFVTIGVNYGIITLFFLLYMLKSVCFKKFFSYSFLLWIFLLADMGFNTYVVIFSIILFMMNNYFIEQINCATGQMMPFKNSLRLAPKTQQPDLV